MNGNGSIHADSYPGRILKMRDDDPVSSEAPSRVRGEPTHSVPEDELPILVHELRIENERLKQLLDQARQRLEKTDRMIEQTQAREQEYERLLEEKSEVIRQLHLELQNAGGRRAEGPAAPNEEELIALHQELEREREQLKQDEEALMSQVREMEIQMSRERADLARQKNELTRLQNELKHQLEIASRDASLRERLGPLYKLQEEIQRRRPQGR